MKNNRTNQAIDLFKQIENPDGFIFNIFFNACAQLSTEESLHLAKKVFEEIPKSFRSNLYVLTSMLDTLMRCGDVSSAQSLFDRSAKKDLTMYGTMMKGNYKHFLFELVF